MKQAQQARQDAASASRARRLAPAVITAVAIAFVAVRFVMGAHETLARTRDGACTALEPDPLPAVLQGRPTPTSARKISSISNDVETAEPMVAIDHTKIPAKITFLGPMRSAMGPEISEASANTPRFTPASHPTLKFDSWKVDWMNGVIP